MPTSHRWQLDQVVELIALTRPESLLDIGVGFGKYGALAREYLDVWGAKAYGEWKTRIDGIEIHESYLTPLHRFVYDHLYIGDAIQLLPTLDSTYELVLLIDVLEHFDYPRGVALVRECRKRGRNVLISTPKDIGVKAESFGNPHEAHLFQWRKSHFREYHPCFFVPNVGSLICYIGDDAPRVRAQRTLRVDEIFLSSLERTRLFSPSRLKRLLRVRE